MAADPAAGNRPMERVRRRLQRRVSTGSDRVALVGSDRVALVGTVLSLLSWPLAAAATFVAVAPFLPVFSSGSVVPILVGAAAVATVLPAVVARMGRAALWSVLATIVAYVAFMAVAVLHQAGFVTDLARGLGDGASRLLSTTLPVAGPRRLLVVPVTVVWLVGATAGELLVRRRSVGAATACWVVGFVVSTAFAAGGPGRSDAPAIALLGVAGTLFFIRRWLATAALAPADSATMPGRSQPVSGHGAGVVSGVPTAGSVAAALRRRWPGGERRSDSLPLRPLLFGAVTLAMAAALSAVVVPRLPGLAGAPVAPARRPPVRLERPITPTDAMANLREDDPTAPATPEFTVRTDRPFDGYLALAILDSYNGDTWQMNRTFVPTGGRVPVPLGAPVGGQVVVQHYRILRALPVPWMPAVDRVTSVSGVPVDYNATSAMVVPSTSLPRGTTYQVRSQAPVATLGTMSAPALRSAPAGSPDPADLSVPASVQPYLGAVVDALAAQTGQAPAPSLSFLAAVETNFRLNYGRIDPAATAATAAASAAISGGSDEGGTAFAEVVHAVMTARQATPEQYATLFALVARQLGVPARLVTGFRVAPPGATPGVAPGNRLLTVTNRQAWTWVELPVAGSGWVVADPAPLAVTTPRAPVVSEGPTSTTPPSSAHAVAVSNGGHAVAAPVRRARTPSPDPWWWVAGAAGLLVLGGVALLATASLRRYRRRRRRRRGSPELRLLGAWYEMLDVLAESWCTGLRSLTATEVAALAGERFGVSAEAPLASVGALADRLLFSSGDPEIDDVTAGQAWQSARRLGGICRRRLTRRQRVLALARVARSDQDRL